MVRSPAFRVVWPAVASAAACLVFAGARLAANAWDPKALAELGTRYTLLEPNGTEGYDGQFTYMMALDLEPTAVGPHLDRPAYRYQRILLPVVARWLSFGDEPAIPWALLGVSVVSAAVGTAAVARWMLDRGLWEGYALGFGLWVGVVASAGLFLHEALAYGLVAVGWLACRRGRPLWGAAALGLALFAKETTLPFWAAGFFVRGPDGHADRRLRLGLAASGVAFVLFQIWLLAAYGEVGLGSGGAMGTPFELVPLMGFVRIGSVSPEALALYALVFGPTIVLPALWAAVSGGVRLVGDRTQAEAWALLLNAGLILVVPFSTAREPLGLVRLATGLVLAVLLFAATHGRRRVLNYSLFWSAMLALLVRQ